MKLDNEFTMSGTQHSYPNSFRRTPLNTWPLTPPSSQQLLPEGHVEHEAFLIEAAGLPSFSNRRTHVAQLLFWKRACPPTSRGWCTRNTHHLWRSWPSWPRIQRTIHVKICMIRMVSYEISFGGDKKRYKRCIDKQSAKLEGMEFLTPHDTPDLPTIFGFLFPNRWSCPLLLRLKRCVWHLVLASSDLLNRELIRTDHWNELMGWTIKSECLFRLRAYQGILPVAVVLTVLTVDGP